MSEEKKVDKSSGITIGNISAASGNINISDLTGGDKIGRDNVTTGNISEGSGVAIGREAQATVTSNINTQEIDKLFTALVDVIAAETKRRGQALEEAQALKDEVSKGDEADDSRMAKLIDGLVELVPGAVSTITSMFASPILAGFTGPITKFVLDQIQGKN